MVKVMYNDQLVYKIVIWVLLGISLLTEKVALNLTWNWHQACKSHDHDHQWADCAMTWLP